MERHTSVGNRRGKSQSIIKIIKPFDHGSYNQISHNCVKLLIIIAYVLKVSILLEVWPIAIFGYLLLSCA